MVIGLPFVGSLVLLIPSVQTSIVRLITNRLSHDLSAKISIEGVRALPYAGIRLSGFLLLDQAGDTLFYTDQVRTGIEDLSLRQKHLYLRKVHFSNPKIELKEVDGKMNYTFLLDSLGKNSSDSVKWHYSIKGLKIEKGDITVSNQLLNQKIFSQNKLHFKDLNLDAVRKSNVNDTLVFEIANFSVKEDIGISIQGLKTTGRVLDDKIVIDDLAFRTQKSSFDVGLIEIPLKREDAHGNMVSFRTEARQLVIDPSEAKLFVPDLPLIDGAITFSGLVYGNLNNLKGRKITATIGKNTFISTNFDIDDFSNFNTAFLYLDIESSQTTVDDLELLFPGEEKVFPPTFNSLGVVRYKGNVTGFVSDLVAFGTFTSDLGNLKTDIGIKLYDNREVIFAGSVSTLDFNLGKLLGEHTQLGNLSLNLEIQGQRKTDTNYFVFMDGTLGRFDFKDYLYKNISVQGLLTHQKFDGQLNIDDPNGKLDFAGTVDLSTEVPSFNFSAVLKNLFLDRLNILPSLTDGVLSLNVETNIHGDHLDDLVGHISLSDGILFTPSGVIDFDTVLVAASRYEAGKRLVVQSPFMDGQIEGRYSFRNIERTIYYYLEQFLPSPARTLSKGLPSSDENNFAFEFFLKSNTPFKLLVPELNVSDRGFAKGSFSPADGVLDLEVSLGKLEYKSIKGDDLNLKIFSSNSESSSLTFRAVEARIGDFFELPNLSVHQKMWNDTLTTNIFWNNWDEVTNSGALYSMADFRIQANGHLASNILLSPSTIIMNDSIWNIHESIISFHSQGMAVKDFRIDRYPQFISVNGFLHHEKEDGLVMQFNDMDISQFLKGTDVGNISFAGFIDGELKLRDYYREPLLTSDIEIKEFEFNHDPLGTFYLTSSWNKEIEAVEISTLLQDAEYKRLVGGGYFYPSEKRIDLAADLDSMRIGFLRPFINKVLQNIEGTASGNLFFKGELSQPYLTGRVKVDEGSFDVDMLNTTYYIQDSVTFYPQEIRFENMTVADRYNQKGKFKGSIYHSGGFIGMRYDLRVDANNMMLMNTRWNHNPYYYGTIFGNAALLVTGDNSNVDIAIRGSTLSGTRFFIPVQNKDRAGESNFIRFANATAPLSEEVTPTETGYKVDLSGVKLDMDIEVTPEAEVQIIFDERIGDILRSRGGGNVQIRINRQGDIKFYGDYTIQDGEYLFSLQNLINKRFDIVQGGTVKWQGDPYNADIDIMAVYKLRASLSDLFGEVGATSSSQDRADMQRRVLIHSNLMLSGLLQQPIIKFGIELPTLDESREALVLEYMATEEELNRQVLSLLILNKFYTPEYMRSEQGGADTYNNAALLTTTEMLSSQISKWISSISNDLDIGVAYRPGDNLTSEEFELALSTQVFNNRVSLNGNVGVGKYQANTSTMIGDFDVDIKLNKSGTIRARAYTRSNEDYLYEPSLTTQGVGISFKEEFNHVKELIQKYWRMLAVRRKEEK